ncbi:MAG: UdgX family uracil-DNA binding protein [Alphaproteobacteria bacterium]|nr:UdgX family uracil-DNA binding protein [Alphaproteobacteria bacterium]
MKRVAIQPGADLDGFRAALRRLIAADVPPQDVVWDAAPSLFEETASAAAPPVALPRRVADIIRLVVCHSDPERYALLYQLVWRIRHGEKTLPAIASDPLIHRLHGMEKSVRRDLHKMHAYVRFRRVETPDGDHFVAWFEPDHFILEATAQFFIDRFISMRWSILTPVGSLHLDRDRLVVGPPAQRSDAPQSDGFEEGWRTYYESTFNPARLNPTVMRSHMAKKYWKNLPEAQSIPDLIRSAPSRVRQMIEQESAMPRKRDPQKAVAAMADQAPKSLAALNKLILAAQPMVQGGTRAVLGEGPHHPDIAFVGEQPGDQEDLAGKPFVGPAGQLLDKAMAEAGIDRKQAYVTNAVKHFKFEPRGKRRIHAKPTAGEVKHYRWWLEKELDLVKPKLVVALGATAALALAGKPLAVAANRGSLILDGRPGFITIHPSFLLRMPDEDKARAWKEFVADMKAIRRLSREYEKAA